MKNHIFIVAMLSFSGSMYADVFDDLDKEVALIDKYCADGEGRISEELVTSRSNKTGEIISEKIESIVYCRNGQRHVVDKSEVAKNKLSKDTVKLIDASKIPAPSNEYICTFSNSFLIGSCNGNTYFYDEKLSSVKRKNLDKFYRFVKKSNGEDQVSDQCVELENKKHIRCNDMGLILLLGETLNPS